MEGFTLFLWTYGNLTPLRLIQRNLCAYICKKIRAPRRPCAISVSYFMLLDHSLLFLCADILWKETCDVKAPLFLNVYYYLTLLLLLYCCAEILSMQPRDAEVLLFKNGKLRGRLHSGIKVPWLNPMCDMTHSHAWRDSFKCVPWLIYTCLGCCTLASRCLHALISVTWLMHQCDVTYLHVWHTSHILWHNGCTLPSGCHDAFICVP